MTAQNLNITAQVRTVTTLGHTVTAVNQTCFESLHKRDCLNTGRAVHPYSHDINFVIQTPFS